MDIPGTTSFPLLREKLNYLYTSLSIQQKFIANRFNIHPSTISKWIDADNIPNRHTGPLCKLLGIGIEELKIANMEAFKKAVQERFDINVGTRWKVYAQQRTNSGGHGLDFDVIESNIVKNTGLKGIYQTPQAIELPNGMKRVYLGMSIRFRLEVSRAKLPNDKAVKAILLIAVNPEAVQLLTPEKQDPQKFESNGYYYLPNHSSIPFSIGLPMGKHSAYLVSLATTPPEKLFHKFSQKSDGYAADILQQWIAEEDITCKINSIDFLVNA